MPTSTPAQLAMADIIATKYAVSQAEFALRRIKARMADVDSPNARVLAIMVIADITRVRNALIEMGNEMGDLL